MGPETRREYQKRTRGEFEARLPQTHFQTSDHPSLKTFLEYAAWELEQPLEYGYIAPLDRARRIFSRAATFWHGGSEELCLARVKAEMENPAGVDIEHLRRAFTWGDWRNDKLWKMMLDLERKYGDTKYVRRAFESWAYRGRTRQPEIFDAFIAFEKLFDRIGCTEIFESVAKDKDPDTEEGKEIWGKWARFEEENMVRPWDE